MKFLIVGGGSMGKRRIRCLLANSVSADAIRVVDPRDDRREETQARHGVTGAADLWTGMTWGPDAVIVSVPPVYHMDVCLTAARAGKHVFCEVPLTMGLDGTDELAGLVAEKGIVVAPGIQVPFHPLFEQVKQWLVDPAFGKLLAIHQEWGQYLPDWHPYEDYRSFYAAKQSLGGAALDILGHELATLYCLIDDRVERLHCRSAHLSELEIDGADSWQILARTRGGVSATLCYDLIQRDVHNVCRFIGESGTIELEIAGSAADRARAHRFLTSTRQRDEVTPPVGYDYEQCYVDEIAAFIRCIRGEANWHVSMADAVAVVRFLTASLASDATQQWADV